MHDIISYVVKSSLVNIRHEISLRKSSFGEKLQFLFVKSDKMGSL